MTPTHAAPPRAGSPPVPARSADHDARRRSAIGGAFLSQYIDMFDIYLPVVALAPVMFLFRPRGLSPEVEAVLASLVFITTLLGRPVGALVFGLVADGVGRRAASIVSVAGFGLVTLLIGLLPGQDAFGQDALGPWAYVLLVGLRFLDGVFLGGGYTGSIPLAFEYAKREERGLVGGLILAGFPAAYLSINGVTMLMFWLAPLDGPGSPYAVWGWRVPFLMGAAMAGGLALYYVRAVSESEVWRAKAAATAGAAPAAKASPLAGLLSGRGGRDLLQVLLLMTGFWTTQNVMTLYVPTGLLGQTLGLGGYALTATLMVTYAVLVFSYVGAGLVGQRVGRRRFFLALGPLIATLGAGLLYALAVTPGLGFGPRLALVCLMAVVVTAPWGVLVTYVNERFATGVRATGFGVGYSLSVVVPSFYAFYLDWLGALVPPALAPAVLLAAGGLIGAAGALLGPETRDVEFGPGR